MNAPLLNNLDTIDSYSDLLSREFKEETLSRREMLSTTKTQARKAVAGMAQDFDQLENKVTHIDKALHANRQSFARLERVSLSQESDLTTLTARLRELSRLLHEQAQVIKTNNTQ